MDEILSGFDYLTYYFYLLYYKFIGYPIVVRICIAVVTLCVVFYLFLALYLAYGIYRRQREKKSFQRIYDRFYEPLKEVLGDREAAVCIELTKLHERVSRGYLSDLAREFADKKVKGEVALVIAGNNPKFARTRTNPEEPRRE